MCQSLKCWGGCPTSCSFQITDTMRVMSLLLLFRATALLERNLVSRMSRTGSCLLILNAMNGLWCGFLSSQLRMPLFRLIYGADFCPHAGPNSTS